MLRIKGSCVGFELSLGVSKLLTGFNSFLGLC